MAANGNARFDAEAAAWDSNPDVHRASDGALVAILDAFPLLKKQRDDGVAHAKGMDVLEIGCGTGLLSLRVAPYVRSLLAIDASEGMISALKQKLSNRSNGSNAPSNIEPLHVMLEDPEDPRLPAASNAGQFEGQRRKFDLILSHLVLHHIADLSTVLETMYGCLKPGGSVALTDYEDFGPEAKRFHPEAKMAGVERHGIDKKWFASLMAKSGFSDVKVEPAWTMLKDVERFPGEWKEKKPCGEGVDLEQMDFPFLLCRGKKA